jgi:hypothetical protein
VLEIIPIDMQGERCKMITIIYLQLFLGVTRRDETMEIHAKALRIINEVQMNAKVGAPKNLEEG